MVSIWSFDWDIYDVQNSSKATVYFLVLTGKLKCTRVIQCSCSLHWEQNSITGFFIGLEDVPSTYPSDLSNAIFTIRLISFMLHRDRWAGNSEPNNSGQTKACYNVFAILSSSLISQKKMPEEPWTTQRHAHAHAHTDTRGDHNRIQTKNKNERTGACWMGWNYM